MHVAPQRVLLGERARVIVPQPYVSSLSDFGAIFSGRGHSSQGQALIPSKSGGFVGEGGVRHSISLCYPSTLISMKFDLYFSEL